MVLTHLFGRIFQLKDEPRGYTRMTIATDLPYRRQFVRFNIWDLPGLKTRYGDGFQEGAEVQYSYDTETQYPYLTDFEPCLLGSCTDCYAQYELGDAQKISCGDCDNLEVDRLDVSLKLESSKIKKYTYSKGISVCFTEQETKYICRVFETSPLFEDLQTLEVGVEYTVVGWRGEKLEDGNFYFSLIDVPEKA